MFRLNLDVRIGTRFKIVLDGITGHMVQGGKGGMRSPRVGVVPAKGKKPGEGAESITQSGHFAKYPF